MAKVPAKRFMWVHRAQPQADCHGGPMQNPTKTKGLR